MEKGTEPRPLLQISPSLRHPLGTLAARSRLALLGVFPTSTFASTASCLRFTASALATCFALSACNAAICLSISSVSIAAEFVLINTQAATPPNHWEIQAHRDLKKSFASEGYDGVSKNSIQDGELLVVVQEGLCAMGSSTELEEEC